MTSAQGSAHPDNMSVDARAEHRVVVPPPGLALAVEPEHPAAHPKDTVTQTATVTNTGDAPAANVSVRPRNRPKSQAADDDSQASRRPQMWRQLVKFSTTVTNTGDTPLFDLNARTATNGCTATQGQLNPGATTTVDCAAPAGDESGTLTSTVTATDKIGKKAQASASAQVKVTNPRLTITAVVQGPTRAR